MGRGILRLAAALATSGVVMLVAAASASATFHLIKIREVSPGTNGLDNSYVEVQMYAPFQNFLSGGAKVVVCNDICSIVPGEFGGFSNVPNGSNQDTVLFGDSGVSSKDFNVNLNLDDREAGGAACYVSEPGFNDCVSWGSFSASSTLMSNYGASADPGGPAPPLISGMALRRSITANCPTALDAGDDTNNSAADFAQTMPNPRPNPVPPTEATCAPAGPTGSPAQPPSTPKKKKKCRKRKRVSSPGSTGGGTVNPPAYAAKKKKCKKKRK